jgi:hypothetical protein
MRAVRIPFVQVLFLIACVGAALAPFLPRGPAQAGITAGFPGWPTHYEGRRLAQVPLSAREQGFVADFPGKIGRFSDGQREIIIRWVAEPTRHLHPAADCLRGIGYAIKPLPVQSDANGTPMSCLRATRDGEALSVCEVLRDTQGQSWPDVSAWYWSALFSGGGPWWSYVVASPT